MSVIKGVLDVAVAYHLQTVPLVPGDAVNVMGPAPQRAAFVGIVGAPGIGLTLTVKVMVLSQPAELGITIVRVPAEVI